MINGARVAVVIPCYKVIRHIEEVVAAIGPEVDRIYCVDDKCPEGSGDFIARTIADPRVVLLRNPVNLGVGGAVMHGYRQALADGLDIAVKIDGDGQMDPHLLPKFAEPIAAGRADYTKGNRFYNLGFLSGMPRIRLFGNAALSFASKVSSGYWDLFDPTNGYTAISLKVVRHIELEKVASRYFFESDMLFRLNIARARVIDIPMAAVYGEEVSGLHIGKIIGPFLRGHTVNLFKRIGYNYFLRDFNIASLQLIFAILLFAFGTIFGSYSWAIESARGEYASPGTVMLAALPILVAVQLLLAAVAFDISMVPKEAVHPLMPDFDDTPKPRAQGEHVAEAKSPVSPLSPLAPTGRGRTGTPP